MASGTTYVMTPDELLATAQLIIAEVGLTKEGTGYPLHRKNRENGPGKSLSGKTGNLEILPKHREFGLLML